LTIATETREITGVAIFDLCLPQQTGRTPKFLAPINQDSGVSVGTKVLESGKRKFRRAVRTTTLACTIHQRKPLWRTRKSTRNCVEIWFYLQ
jgi:hypothetical protein